MIWSDLVVRLQQCVGNLCSSPDGGAVGSPAVCCFETTRCSARFQLRTMLCCVLHGLYSPLLWCAGLVVLSKLKQSLTLCSLLLWICELDGFLVTCCGGFLVLETMVIF